MKTLRNRHVRRTSADGVEERPEPPAREPGPAAEQPTRPRTPRDPDPNDPASMWPDPYAGHRRR
jgi:hypothetical protein